MPGALPYKQEQLVMMLQSFSGYEAVRDTALFATGCGTGFRIAELLSLKRRDVVNQYGEIRNRITVNHTKGKKSRTVVLNDFAKPFLIEWLVQQEIRGFRKSNTWLWTLSTGYLMYYEAFLRSIKKTSEVCRLDGRYTTHSMRKTFAMHTYLYYHKQRISGVLVDPLLKTREAMGHSNIEATSRYLQFMLGNTDESTKQLYSEIDSESILKKFSSKIVRKLAKVNY